MAKKQTNKIAGKEESMPANIIDETSRCKNPMCRPSGPPLFRKEYLVTLNIRNEVLKEKTVYVCIYCGKELQNA